MVSFLTYAMLATPVTLALLASTSLRAQEAYASNKWFGQSLRVLMLRHRLGARITSSRLQSEVF